MTKSGEQFASASPTPNSGDKSPCLPVIYARGHDMEIQNKAVGRQRQEMVV